MSEEFNFITINGQHSVNTIQGQLRDRVSELLSSGVID